jgi:hypothetical protein
MLADQQLVIHAFAPADGPAAQRAYGQIQAIWFRCRDLLGITVPISDLPTTLPSRVEDTAELPVVAALEDPTAARQMIVRRIRDVVNFSIDFTAPPPVPDRRRRIGSASPPGWVEFDRWWDELASTGTDALLGLIRLYLAEYHGDGPPLAAAAGVRAELPRTEEAPLWWERGETRLDHFAVWDLTPEQMTAERRIGIVAPAGHDADLCIWTWSNGGPDLPPFARYLLHATKIRYEARVWDGGRPIEQLRRRVNLAVDQLRQTLGGPDQPAASYRLMVEETHLATAMQDVRDMRRTVEIATHNMKQALADPLSADLALAHWLDQVLGDAMEYLASCQDTAAQVQTIAQRTGPTRSTDPSDQPIVTRRPDVGKVELRLGFGVDIVGYGARPAPAKDEAQRRLAGMLREVLADMRIGLEETDRQDAGDATKVFLPHDVEIHRALAALLSGWRTYLARDNQRYRDQIRLRFAADLGPVGLAALGFGGETIVKISRLLDSAALRAAAAEHPHAMLVALLSDDLYRMVVAPGYDGFEGFQFQKVEVTTKDFSAPAWLWIAK